jgi:hypothetical protein
MKKETLALAAAVLAGAIASPALADVTVTATINKTKDITVNETITINKLVDLSVAVREAASNAAEAMSLANVSNHDNTTDRTITPVALPGGVSFQGNLTPENGIVERHATIESNSISDNVGGVGVNQDTGNSVNQGNLVSFSVTQGSNTFANAQTSVDQRNFNNTVNWGPFLIGTVTNTDPITLTALIDTSINNNTGIVGVNQNSGNNNNQTNAVALAAGLDVPPPAADPNTIPSPSATAIALAESDLGQLNSGNVVNEVNAHKTGQIFSSINGNTGIVGVNQAVGNNSNQANTVSVAATLAP